MIGTAKCIRVFELARKLNRFIMYIFALYYRLNASARTSLTGIVFCLKVLYYTSIKSTTDRHRLCNANNNISIVVFIC